MPTKPILGFIVSAFALLTFPLSLFAAPADYVVISEIKHHAGGTDEFVELYNPTASDISLDGWKLTRKNSTGTEANLVSAFNDTAIIPAHSFFLITHPQAESSPSADYVYSAASNALTNNYTVLLYDNSEEPQLVDKVGYGTAADFETEASPNPNAAESLERKAFSTSTVDSMTTGDDANQGNSEDSNDNFNDFIIRTTPNPQNSSVTEIPSSITPTPTPTPTPTDVTPSPTPTDEVTPTPTTQPSPTPTTVPSPTPTITPTPTTQPTPTPTPTPRLIVEFTYSSTKCYIGARPYTIFGMTFSRPHFYCTR